MTKSLSSIIGITILFIATNICVAQNIYTFAGTGTTGFSGDGGTAIGAELNGPNAVDIDGSGNVYISDGFNNRIRKINSIGIISTIAGTGVSGSSGDGNLATNAQLYYPHGVAFDGLGNTYIVDRGNNRIRKIDPSGVISTFAGTGVAGYSGDGGTASNAQLSDPSDIAFDASGNSFVCDKGNNRIRKITPAGIISNFAGTGVAGFSGDGGVATGANLNQPARIAIDGLGNIYFSDYFNNRIRKVNSGGIISTFAGTGILGFSGDGNAAINAQLNQPTGLTFDSSGNLYIADTDNNRVRLINPAGNISTIAGTGISGFSGDGGLANIAQLNLPIGITIGPSDVIYISDKLNQRIRKVCSINCSTNIHTLTGNDNNILIYPNPNNGSFALQIDTEIGNGEIILINFLGQKVYEQKISQGQNYITTNGLATGLYSYIILQDKGQISNGKVKVE